MKKILFIGVICLFCSISVFSQSKKKWEKTQSLNSISAYQDFINKYPDGQYTDLAKQQLLLLKEQKAKRKELEEAERIANAKATSDKIIPGVTMEEVISILQMGESLNRSSMGGLFIGMGVFPQNANEKSSYTGDASLDGYDIVFENGKVVSKKIVTERLGSKKANFSYNIKL